MFIDETVIEVRAGDGGNGCFAYAREKYKPRGKPNGGSGGRGGHIYIKVSDQIQTLQDVSYHRSYKAMRGAHGKGSDKDGKNGVDIIIPLPVGTVVYDEETQELIHDCLVPNELVLVAKAGRGGRGNGSLMSHSNRNPDRAEPGKPGQERKLRMVLKILADVGLVGKPNAGKSTFLSTISRAHPKIADYPFTTTEPCLGIVSLTDNFNTTSFTVADIPGLIEGAHQGKGLGIRFLKHIERTRIIALMVESTCDDPVKEAEILIHELRQYSHELAEKPKCFILTKTDSAPHAEHPNLDGWFKISSLQRDGITPLLYHLKDLIAKTEYTEEEE